MNENSENTPLELPVVMMGVVEDGFGSTKITYATSNLNQYTAITEAKVAPFSPTFDADGNQTKVKTSTGIWDVAYNAENRPVKFTQDGTEVECGYDYMGRRWYRKVTQDGTVTQHERYLYRGALQIAALDMLQSAAVTHTLLWDPASGQATEPLALTTGGSLYLYGIDFEKNVSELMNEQGQSIAVYDYAPYGSVTSDGELAQVNPLQWSSEVFEPEQALSYYNYRHYAPLDGRWISRDPVGEGESLSLYMFVENNPVFLVDVLGLAASGGGSGSGEASGGNCCCVKTGYNGKKTKNPMKGCACCNNGIVVQPRVCKIMIVMSHSNGKKDDRIVARLKAECKNKADKVGVVSCNQEQTAGHIPSGRGFDNKKRRSDLLPKGDSAVDAMFAETQAAIDSAKDTLCKSNEKCCSSVTVSIVSAGGNAGEDLANFQEKHKEYKNSETSSNRHRANLQKPIKCVDENEKPRSCTERGGEES